MTNDLTKNQRFKESQEIRFIKSLKKKKASKYSSENRIVSFFAAKSIKTQKKCDKEQLLKVGLNIRVERRKG